MLSSRALVVLSLLHASVSGAWAMYVQQAEVQQSLLTQGPNHAVFSQQHSLRRKSDPATGQLNELFNDDRIAVVVYAPAVYARQLRCEATIESLRSLGRWGGRIYLITEHVKCYQHERWTQCGLDADIVVLDDPLKTKAARKWMLYGGSPWELVKDRLIRAELWELLQPPPQVQMLMYLHGCDLLVGGPVQPFMQQALTQLQHTADKMEARKAQLEAQQAELEAVGGDSQRLNGSISEPAVAHGAAHRDEKEAGSKSAGSGKHLAGSSHVAHRSAQQSGAGVQAAPADVSHASAQGSAIRAQGSSNQAPKDGAQTGGKGKQHAVDRDVLGVQLVLGLPPLDYVDPTWSDAKLTGKHLGDMDWGADVWAIHRTASEPLLKAWTREVLLTPDARTGPLLRAAIHHMEPSCGSSDTCVAPYLAIHTSWSQELECDKEEGCGAKRLPATFNYLPASVCLSFDNAAVSDWVEMLDLCVYQQLGFCPPLVMTPFTFAWLPYPMCSKLELGLSKLACQWSCTETSFIRTPSRRTTVTARTLPVPFEGMRP